MASASGSAAGAGNTKFHVMGTMQTAMPAPASPPAHWAITAAPEAQPTSLAGIRAGGVDFHRLPRRAVRRAQWLVEDGSGSALARAPSAYRCGGSAGWPGRRCGVRGSLLPVELRHANHTASTNAVILRRNFVTKPYNRPPMASASQIDQIAERVERLLVRYEELQRTNALLAEQVEAAHARARLAQVAPVRGPRARRRAARTPARPQAPDAAMKQLEVQIMGQSYLLGCPEGGEQRLLEAVEKVDTAMCKIRDAGKVKARDRIAVLAALNLAFDVADRECRPGAAAARQPRHAADGEARDPRLAHAAAAPRRRAGRRRPAALTPVRRAFAVKRDRRSPQSTGLAGLSRRPPARSHCDLEWPRLQCVSGFIFP